MVLNLKAFFAFLLTLFGALAFSFASIKCEGVFASQEVYAKIQFYRLAELRLRLERAKAQGHQSISITALKSEYAKKEQELKNNFSPELFNLVFTSAIDDLQRRPEAEEPVQEERNENLRNELELLDTSTYAKKIIFHRVKADSSEIAQDFSLMATPVTQMMYAKIMIELGNTEPEIINPSVFVRDENSTVYSVNGVDIPMRPDDPVAKVRYTDLVNTFIPGLNKLSQSSDPNVQAFLKKLITDHRIGDQYDLPTQAQLEFSMKKSKTQEGDAIDDILKKNSRDARLAQYIRYNQTDATGTAPVSSTLPLLIDGSPFFLYGNISNWTKNTDFNGWHISHGSSWASASFSLDSGKFELIPPDGRSPHVGFRLVRTNR